MKVLIGTPAYRGLVNTTYALALQETIVGLVRDGIDYAIYMIANEALIQRARNKIASYALRGGYDRLVFIDADITWTYTDKARLSAKRRLDVLRNLRRQRHPHPP